VRRTFLTNSGLNKLNMKQNLEYLDIARGFAIFAVVFIHGSALYLAENTNSVISIFNQLSFFCVPLFIGVSGFLDAASSSNNRDNRMVFLALYTKRRFMRLMVPYFIFSILYIAIRVCLEQIPASANLVPVKFNNYRAIISAIFLVKGNPAGQLYYLPLLFFIIVTFKLLETAFMNMRLFLTILCISLSIISYALWGDIYRSLNPLKGIGFYAAGYFLYSFRNCTIITSFLNPIILGTGFLFIVGIFIHRSPLLQFIHQSCGTVFVFCLSLVISRKVGQNLVKTGLLKFGRTSFTIYLLHEPYLVTVSYLVLTKIMNASQLASFVIAIIIGIAISMLLNDFIFSKGAFLSKWFLGKSSLTKKGIRE
jgi:peptidoglycan/LPS O-acetylase OafA/YrhL